MIHNLGLDRSTVAIEQTQELSITIQTDSNGNDDTYNISFTNFKKK